MSFWSFNRKPKQSFGEWAATQPPAKCGDNETHYYWTVQGMLCPRCAASKAKRESDAKDERLATLIANKVIKYLEDRL